MTQELRRTGLKPLDRHFPGLIICTVKGAARDYQIPMANGRISEGGVHAAGAATLESDPAILSFRLTDLPLLP